MDSLKVRRVNAVLLWALPVAFLGAGADLAHRHSQITLPVRALPPSLEELTRALPAVEPPGFSGAFFEQPRAAAAQAPAEPSGPVVAPEAQWKLRGVLMLSGNRKAFLEDDTGKTVWITEGERIGSAQVKEIKEHSVLLERKDGDYELRM